MSRIFLSYRREDTEDITGRIYDHLVGRFGRDRVFKDVDSIPYGTDFRKVIEDAIGQSAIFLPIIGDRWLSLTDAENRRRIDDPADYVRIEIEEALKRNIQILPLLVRGTQLPSPSELPEDIKSLTYRNAAVIRNDPDFSRDIARLIEAIGKLLTGTTRTELGHNRSQPLPSLTSPEPRNLTSSLTEIEHQLKKRLCGQQIAVDCVLPWLKRVILGLYRDDKPAATFLFVGHTGVGKTLLAKELARIICGDVDRLRIFDMGQYGDPAATVMLLGAPHGYVGFGEGRLVNTIRDMPNAVLCFDEINLASPQALDVLLRLVDRGFLQDADGARYDARRTTVIFVANPGRLRAEEYELEDPVRLTELMRKSAKDQLPSELIARVDEIVCFLPFSIEACRQIVDLAIDELQNSLEAKSVRVTVDKEARALIAAEFHRDSRDVGARGASRHVQRLLAGPILDALTLDDPGHGAEPLTFHAGVNKNGDVAVLRKEG